MGLLDTNNYLTRQMKLFILFFSYLLVITVVYFTGGTKFSYPHLIYIPILFSSIFFRLAGGILGGLISGIMLAIMPLDTATFQMQTTANWLMRLILLVNFGFVSGLIFKIIIKQYTKLEKIAYYDIITGLENKIILKKRLDELKLKNTKFSLISISIDNILEILNLVGHSQSELLLKEIANYLNNFKVNSNFELYNSYTFRFEFLLTNFSDKYIEEWTKDFVKHIQDNPIFLDKASTFLKLTLGIYASSDNQDKSDEIIKKTYLAIDYANSRGSDYAFYNINMEDKFSTTTLISEVVNSLKHEHFHLEYQPKLNLQDNKVYGVEALIRWNHPVLGKISPIDFIPQLEKTSYINSLTYWILNRVIEDLKDWKSKGIDLKISINITPYNIQSKEFVKKMLQLMDNFKESFSVELELTESALMNELESIKEILADFKDKGIKIYIDDFGTGYSSLAYLKNLPIDYIKIDKSFIDEMITDENDKEIVNTTIKLGHALGKIIVAEGVDNKETLDLLKQMGCNEIQGYYFAKPMKKDVLEEFLKINQNYKECSNEDLLLEPIFI